MYIYEVDTTIHKHRITEEKSYFLNQILGVN